MNARISLVCVYVLANDCRADLWKGKQVDSGMGLMAATSSNWDACDRDEAAASRRRS
ncbi:unnamed protein product [Taenia asiatica]|uniref:Uncharacterized protein n=1 Tax=Taenia asiatica TaxID=60517 RepID=A0A3P6P434_TAEAS|nr:unnamed protein product [Taenia asiatica]